MKAMILAAGLGTRMQELTRTRPKPMLPVLNIPLIAHTLYLLHRNGCEFAVINTHYLGDQIISYLEDFPYFTLQFTRESTILGTGGGISGALRQTDLSGYFWVLNPDCIYLPEFSLAAIATNSHSQKGSPTSAPAVESTDNSPPGIPSADSLEPHRPLLMLTDRSHDSSETGFQEIAEGTRISSMQSTAVRFSSSGNLMYCGLALLHEDQFQDISFQQESNVVDIWKKRAESHNLLGCLYTGSILDAGRKEDYLAVYKDRNAFPLTYIQGLTEFMEQWKGSTSSIQ